jgi:glycosyltransferase involved in cell wall biosynthesis
MNGVSVVICCCNSGWVLPQSLRALARQDCRDGLPWEICVVDNNSTDNTAECVREFIEAHPELAVRLLEERQPGVSFARTKGINSARYNTLVFSDDDTLLAPDYLLKAAEFMEKHADAGLCGGYGEPVFECEPDARVRPYIEYYACGPQGPEPFCDITKRGFVSGAGTVLRKSAWDKIVAAGFAFMSPGRRGSVLIGGDDVEMGCALRAAGYRIYYWEELRYEHILPARRLTWDYLLRMSYGSGYSVFAVPEPGTLFSYRSHPLFLAGFTSLQWLRRVVLPPRSESHAERERKMAYFRGMIAGILGNFRKSLANRRRARAYYRRLSHVRERTSVTS